MLALEGHIAPAFLALPAYAARVAQCGNVEALIARWLDDHDALAMADVPAAWRCTLARFAALRGDADDVAELPLRRAIAVEKGVRERRAARTAPVVAEATAAVVDPLEGERLAARIEAMESPDEFAPLVAAIEASSLAHGYKRALARAARQQRDRLAAGWSAE